MENKIIEIDGSAGMFDYVAKFVSNRMIDGKINENDLDYFDKRDKALEQAIIAYYTDDTIIRF